MIITVWDNYNKKENSTAAPSTLGRNFNINIKSPCTIITPALLINIDINSIQSVTYFRWNNRYYYVSDIRIIRDELMEIVGRIDVLATYKNDIGAYSCFIERAESEFDEYVYDNYLSNRLSTSVKTSTISSPLPHWTNEGTFIVRTIGQASTASSVGITSYALTKGGLLNVLEFLFTTDNFDFLADTSVKSFFNPFQYIVSVNWFPFTPLTFGTTLESIKLGWWDSNVPGIVVEETSIVFQVEALLPDSAYSDFRTYDIKWTQIKALVPGCGAIYLNPIECGLTGLTFAYSIDIATGECFVKIFPKNSNYLIATLSGSMSSSISIGQLQTNEVPAIRNALGAIGDLVHLDIASLLERAVDVTIDMAQPTPCINGAAGNMGAILATPFISISRIQYEGCDFQTATSGRPLMRNRVIGSLSGYIKCGNASISISGTSEERTLLNSYLNGGFYYE